MRRTRALTLLLGSTAVFCLGRVSAAAQSATPRQVSAPASDILAGIVRLPDPESVPTVSRAAILPLHFRRDGAGWSAEVALPVEPREEGGSLVIALLSPDASTWKLSARAPGGSMRPIEQVFAVARSLAPAGLELPGWVVDRYEVRAAPSGEWILRVETAAARAPAEGWLLASADRDLRVEAHATTLELVGGEVIGVAARALAAAPPSVERARVVLETSSGALELALQDDGLHEDGRAGDGLFGAIVPESVRGDVRARVELRGSTSSGDAFLRTVQIAFPVLERQLFLDGTARASAIDAESVGIEIGALPLAPSARFHVSAEVWGRDSTGASVPVCWLSRMLGGARSLPLVLDASWLEYAAVSEPVELREVRVQDPDTEVVIDRISRMPLEVESLPVRSGRRGSSGRAITSEMLTGSSMLASSSTTPSGPHTGRTPIGFVPALMLVHGYCSSGSIWPPADFTQPKTVFLDPSQNRTHDQFAQLLAQHASSVGLSSFGIVAHSQGGCAALHLLTYYTSGLDYASGGRRIQSVATPYQGTPLAAFGGFACGVNNDMTPAGSATWLAGIPSWARAEVSYWTTSNSGSACSALTDFLLTDPEDGTVEMFRGQLPGGSSMGHVTGWCHTTGMSNPANYTDHARNMAMDAAAAR